MDLSLVNCIGIQDKVIGSKVRLSLEDTQQHIALIQSRAMVLNHCDQLERPLALISPDGKWEKESDNSQGSQYIRLAIGIKSFKRFSVLVLTQAVS